jgi:signal transduction histidine kinase
MTAAIKPELMRGIPSSVERELTWRDPRFTGSQAFSLRTYVVAMLPLSVGSVIADALPKGAEVPLAWYAAMGALVSVGVVFLVVGAVLSRVFPSQGIARTVSVLAVYAVAEVSRTILVAIALQRNGLDFDMMLHHRVVSGALTGVLVLGVVSIVVNDRARYVSQFEELVSRNHDLERELKFLNDSIDSFVDNLRDTVSQVVDTAFTPIVDRFRIRQSVSDVVEDIVDLSEFVVRPLSIEIQEALPEQTSSLETPPRIRLPKLFDLTTTVKPFQPLAIALVFTLLLTGAALLTMPFPQGVIFLVASIGVTSGVHWLAGKIIAPRLPHWSGLARVAAISTAYAVGPLAVVLSLLAVRGGGMGAGGALVLLYLIVVVEFMSWALAVLPAVRRGHLDILNQQVHTMSDLGQVRSRAEVRLRKEKQRLAAIVHGDIQSTLMATVLKLQMPHVTPDDVDQIIAEARETVAQVLHDAHLPEHRQTLDQVITELTDSWLQLVTITWEVGDGVREEVDSSADLGEILSQVVREATTNAVKHGKADSLIVSLWLDEETGHLVCQAIDNGHQVKERVYRGGGSKLFSAIAHSYDRVREGKHTTLTLNIPLSHIANRLPIRSN